MPKPLPDHVRAAILDDIRAGGTCRGIATKHSVSPSSVRKIAQEAGITDAFERAQTEKATAARQVDTKAARAVEAAETLAVAKHLRAQILTAQSGRDAQGWAVAYGIMIDKNLVLEKHDSDGGTEHARSVLGQLAEGFAAAYEALGDEPG